MYLVALMDGRGIAATAWVADLAEAITIWVAAETRVFGVVINDENGGLVAEKRLDATLGLQAGASVTVQLVDSALIVSRGPRYTPGEIAAATAHLVIMAAELAPKT